MTFQNKKIGFSVQGKGRPLVLLHGFCEDSRMWDDFLTLFTRRKIVRIDLPGFGESEIQDEPSIEGMATSVKAVLDHLKIDKCVLIGHSMGGYVSLEFAKKYEEQLLGLGMFHSHPYEDSEEKKKDRSKSIDFINRNGHIHYIKQVIPSLFAFDFSKGYQFEVNKMLYNAAQYSPEGIISALEAMQRRADNSAVLEAIDCPVLFIIGKEDTALPMKESLNQTALPNIADIHILPSIGHMGMFEAKRKTAKIIKNFLSNVVK
ncbi:MAG: pimeloyl-ACP methyl ester carboxylesterase [Saprospiraceae bacterium]